MNQLLEVKQKLLLKSQHECYIEDFLGGGGQGEVYRAKLGEKLVALKWYLPNIATPEQYQALQSIIQKDAPTGSFLWPFALAESESVSGFGYFMPLREARFKSLNDLMTRRIEPSFLALVTAGIGLADSFSQLHSQGLCYRDISFGNVFFDPNTGEVLICDNDNVSVDGQTDSLVRGTPRFMAPEVVRGETDPNTQSDLFSLAVLLFYLLMGHHPLEGKKESDIRCFDLPAMNKLYGTDPIFIYDPHNDSNRPQPVYHDNARIFWPIDPLFIREIFIKAFTEGIRDPQHGRVRETEWRKTLAKLRDSCIYCGHCGREVFYDQSALQNNGKLGECWNCGKTPTPPPRIKIGQHVVMLNHDTKLYPHHLNPRKLFDFSNAEGAVTRHPKNPNIWGIKNLGAEKWVVTLADGTISDIEHGRSVTLTNGIKINFGKVEGDIRI